MKNSNQEPALTEQQKLEYIMNSNPSLFDMVFDEYQDGHIKYKFGHKYLQERAEKQAALDLKLFEERQQAIYKRSSPKTGDYVLMPSGDVSRITVDNWPDSVQIGGTWGGSYYINSNGGCSYSGSCGDSIRRDKLVDTGELKSGQCWLFSGEWSGAGRGVSLPLQFRVWKLEE